MKGITDHEEITEESWMNHFKEILGTGKELEQEFAAGSSGTLVLVEKLDERIKSEEVVKSFSNLKKGNSGEWMHDDMKQGFYETVLEVTGYGMGACVSSKELKNRFDIPHL